MALYEGNFTEDFVDLLDEAIALGLADLAVHLVIAVRLQGGPFLGEVSIMGLLH